MRELKIFCLLIFIIVDNYFFSTIGRFLSSDVMIQFFNNNNNNNALFCVQKLKK